MPLTDTQLSAWWWSIVLGSIILFPLLRRLCAALLALRSRKFVWQAKRRIALVGRIASAGSIVRQ